MPDDSGNSLYSRIKDIMPYLAGAAVGAIGGPAGMVAGIAGAAEGEVKGQELQASRDEKTAAILSTLEERKQRLAYQQQQAQFMDTLRTRDEDDKNHWNALRLDEKLLHDQDQKEHQAEVLQLQQGNQQLRADSLGIQRELAASLESYRAGNLANNTLRTNATVARSDAQVNRLNLLNDALIGGNADFDKYVKTLPPELQAEAKAYGGTPQARTAFMKEMQRREQSDDPVRRAAAISYASTLTGKSPDELTTEWSGYDGKSVMRMTMYLEQQQAKGQALGPDGLTKAQEAVAKEESAFSKNIEALDKEYDTKFGSIKPAMGIAPDKKQWMMKRLNTPGAMNMSPTQAAQAKRVVDMFVDNKIPIRTGAKMVFGNFNMDKASGGPPEGALRATNLPPGDYGEYTSKDGYLFPKAGGATASAE